MRCKTEALYDPWFQMAVFQPQGATDHYTVSLLLRAPMLIGAPRQAYTAWQLSIKSHQATLYVTAWH